MGTDFSYKGNLAYHPLVISLAGTQEVLRLINRSGNRPSAEEAHEHLGELMPMLKRHHRNILVRGDSAFFRQELLDVCEREAAYFALVVPGYGNLKRLAESLDERAWTPFRTKPERERSKKNKNKKNKSKNKKSRRRLCAGSGSTFATISSSSPRQ